MKKIFSVFLLSIFLFGCNSENENKEVNSSIEFSDSKIQFGNVILSYDDKFVVETEEDEFIMLKLKNNKSVFFSFASTLYEIDLKEYQRVALNFQDYDDFEVNNLNGYESLKLYYARDGHVSYERVIIVDGRVNTFQVLYEGEPVDVYHDLIDNFVKTIVIDK